MNTLNDNELMEINGGGGLPPQSDWNYWLYIQSLFSDDEIRHIDS